MPDGNLLVSTIVSCKWLHDNQHLEHLIILDASVDIDVFDSEGYIPNSRPLDLKAKFNDIHAEFPNTMPSQQQFETEARQLGIHTNSLLVVYDHNGIYWSPRVWWLFKTFGFKNIVVLDGGLPEWKKLGYKTVSSPHVINWKPGDFSATFDATKMVFFDSISQISKDKNTLILDARSHERFNCLVSEPRAGLRSGTIPNSKNLSYTNVLNGNCLKQKHELIAIFDTFTIGENALVFSCGSGITACILALAAQVSDFKHIAVYDGSWTEYGTLTQIDMANTNWTKQELVAYILLYVAHSDLKETKKEHEYILSRVDETTYKHVKSEFDDDNDYQSITKIVNAVNTEPTYSKNPEKLFADIKLMAFADGKMDQMEHAIYNSLKKILS
ncbi:sulfurtransferase [Psychroserpens mesophilus]|uniref:sulfurtransferase n=1 Tax=Psychroserpens mesophilus TaxID=325473 RepID=UPI003D651541